jgi:DNA polymerase I-like protein with 3'-5' exonuclease and polymerase domains
MDRLFRELKLTTGALTDTGRQSYAASALEGLAETNDVVRRLVEIGHLKDLRNKYLVPYFEAAQSSGLLRFEFHQLKGDQYGTVSGRFSSSKPVGAKRGANVQQVIAVAKHIRLHGRRWIIRELFLPGSGLFVASDMSQIEYRVFAHLCAVAGMPRLAEAYASDPRTDFHEKVGDFIHKYRPDFERKRVKNTNFMCLFGGGTGKMLEMLNVGEVEGRNLMRAYHRAFPEARKMLNRAAEKAKSRGYVKTFLGRRARYPKAERLHTALNRAVQGGAADENKLALVALYKERKRLGIKIRMTVHDETAFDAPDEAAVRAAHEVLNRQHFPLRVPVIWETCYGQNWAECDKDYWEDRSNLRRI